MTKKKIVFHNIILDLGRVLFSIRLFFLCFCFFLCFVFSTIFDKVDEQPVLKRQDFMLLPL